MFLVCAIRCGAYAGFRHQGQGQLQTQPPERSHAVGPLQGNLIADIRASALAKPTGCRQVAARGRQYPLGPPDPLTGWSRPILLKNSKFAAVLFSCGVSVRESIRV